MKSPAKNQSFWLKSIISVAAPHDFLDLPSEPGMVLYYTVPLT
jgi:hypothetical protein